MRVSSFGRSVAIALLALGALVGSAGARQGCPAAQPTDALRLTLTPRESNVLIFDAAIEQTSTARIYVEYGNEQLGWLRTPTVEAGSTHRGPIMRLRAETPYLARVFSLDAEGGCPRGYAQAEFTTGSLPDPLRNYTVTATGRPTLPLLSVDWPNVLAFLPPERRANIERLRYTAVLDADGQIVWYYPIPKEYSIPPPEASTYQLTPLPNGSLLFLAGYTTVDEITVDGQTLKQLKPASEPGGRVHHDAVQLTDGRLLYLGAEDRVVDDSVNGGPPDLLMRGDTLHIADLAASTEEQVWSVFDALDPTRRPPQWRDFKIQGVFDYGHANAMGPGSQGNWIVSFRQLDQIIALSPDFKTIQWKLGGLDSSFRFADPSDVFYGQHGVQQLPNGNMLMFDNGNYRPEGEYSRVVEYRLDFAAMSVRKVWEYRPDPEIFSDKVSNVSRLPNGNTLVSFGWRVAPDEPAEIHEVQPDGTLIYRQAMRWRGMPAVRYRASAWPTIAGESAVEPTPVQN